VIHTSPDAPSVDVLANEAKVLGNVPITAASAYLAVLAGSYVFKLYVAGTTATVLTSAGIALEASKV